MNSSTTRMNLINAGIWALLLLAATVSFTHIVQASHKLGLHDWQAYTAPALIDFVAIVGKLSMHHSFTRPFQSSGFRLLMTGGTLSLACNVYAGNNVGAKAFGVLVVGAFMLLEHHATKAGKTAIAPPAEPVQPSADDALKAKRSEAAKRGAATKAANKAKAVRKPRAPKASVKALEEAYSLPSAPVSGA